MLSYVRCTSMYTFKDVRETTRASPRGHTQGITDSRLFGGTSIISYRVGDTYIYIRHPINSSVATNTKIMKYQEELVWHRVVAVEMVR